MWRQRCSEESSCRGNIPVVGDENVDDLAVLIYGPLHAAPDAVDLDVRLMNEPPVTDGMPQGAIRVDQLRREVLHPPKPSHMVQLDTALGEEMLQIPVRTSVAQLPTGRQHDHV